MLCRRGHASERGSVVPAGNAAGRRTGNGGLAFAVIDFSLASVHVFISPIATADFGIEDNQVAPSVLRMLRLKLQNPEHAAGSAGNIE